MSSTAAHIAVKVVTCKSLEDERKFSKHDCVSRQINIRCYGKALFGLLRRHNRGRLFPMVFLAADDSLFRRKALAVHCLLRWHWITKNKSLARR